MEQVSSKASSAPSRRKIYRRNETRILLPLPYIPVIVLFIAVLVQTSPTDWWSPLLALGTVILVLLAYRSFTIGVSVSDDDVAVRNIMRTRRISWDEVTRFDYGTQLGFPIGGVYLNSGRFIGATALAVPLLAIASGDSVVKKALDGLNSELAQQRQPSASGQLEPGAAATA